MEIKNNDLSELLSDLDHMNIAEPPIDERADAFDAINGDAVVNTPAMRFTNMDLWAIAHVTFNDYNEPITYVDCVGNEDAIRDLYDGCAWDGSPAVVSSGCIKVQSTLPIRHPEKAWALTAVYCGEYGYEPKVLAVGDKRYIKRLFRATAEDVDVKTYLADNIYATVSVVSFGNELARHDYLYNKPLIDYFNTCRLHLYGTGDVPTVSTHNAMRIDANQEASVIDPTPMPHTAAFAC